MKFRFLISALILVSAVLARGYLFVNEPQIKVPRGQQIAFEFTLKSEPRINERWQVLKVGDAQIYTPIFPRYQYGERLRVTGRVDENGRIFRPEIEKVGFDNSLYAQIQNTRSLIASRMESLLPRKEGALLVGSVLGVDDMGADFKEQLIKTGTIHVVVVSGQNLAIVAMIFVAAAKYIGRRRAWVLATIAVVFYAALTGFAPPVLRASIMVLMTSLGILKGREVNALWSLLISAFLILFLWPQAIGEISFQLTFAASFGILTLGKLISNFTGPVSSFLPASARSRRGSDRSQNSLGSLRAVGNPSSAATRKIFAIAAIPISAYIFTAPLIFYYFGTVSWTAPIVNVLVAELIAPIMVLGFVVAGLSLVWLPLAQVAAYFAFVPAWLFVQIVSFCSLGLRLILAGVLARINLDGGLI